MATIEVKGVRIGEGAPKIAVPLMAQDEAGLVEQARRAQDAGADIVEWRVDAGPTDLHSVEALAHALAAACPTTPILATLRTQGQGGMAELRPVDYAITIVTLAGTEAIDLIDIERTEDPRAAGALVECAHKHGVTALVSHHDFSSTPQTESMVELICQMAETDADIVKLAVFAHSPRDAFRLMEATSMAREKTDAALLTLAMGEAGKISRLAGEAAGSVLTFCSLEVASAPGQVGLEATRAAIASLHAALASDV